MKVKGNTPRIQYGPVEQYHPDQPINVKFPRPGKRTIVVSQEVTRYYGGTQSGIANMFGEQGAEERKTTRYLPFQIPETVSDEQFQMILNQYNADGKARIFDTIDFKPILTPELESALVQGRTSMDLIAGHQQILNPETGEPVLDKVTNQPLFRLRCFGINGETDINLREYEVPGVAEHKIAEPVGQTRDEDDQSV